MENLYDIAPAEKIVRINKTCEQFGIKNCQLMGETLLRLEDFIDNNEFCRLPKDNKGKTLFNMFKYYYSISGIAKE